MTDNRPLREKLLAMAAQSASPVEAAIARGMLAKLHAVPAVGIESARGLTRADILGAPDRPGPPPLVYRVLMPGGWWALLDEDEVDWGLVQHHHLTIYVAGF
jgi:hypothetical protein